MEQGEALARRWTGKSLVSALSRSQRRRKARDLQISSLEPVNGGNKHLIVPCTIRNANGTTFSTSSFIDCGATGRGFYHTEKAHERNLTIYKLTKPKRLFVANGSPSLAGDITHATDLTIEINGHTETMTFYLTNLGRYEALLGKPWLYVHDPQINWREDSLLFNSLYCRKHCIPKDCGPVNVLSCGSGRGLLAYYCVTALPVGSATLLSSVFVARFWMSCLYPSISLPSQYALGLESYE